MSEVRDNCIHVLVDEKSEHSISTLDELRDIIATVLNDLIKAISCRVTEMCKLEKQTWKHLDDREVECQQMITAIEAAREEKVAEAKLCGD